MNTRILCPFGLTVALSVTTMISSCGGAASTSILTIEGSLDAGLKAFQENEYVTTETHIAVSIKNGHLQPDLMENAFRTLAVSRICLDKLPTAESDLAALSPGAADMDLYWVAFAELALKKGDIDAAKDAAIQARLINPDIELRTELQGK